MLQLQSDSDTFLPPENIAFFGPNHGRRGKLNRYDHRTNQARHRPVAAAAAGLTSEPDISDMSAAATVLGPSH